MVVLLLAAWVFLGLIGGFVAVKKGYAPKTGILIGILLGPIAIVVMALMPSTNLGKQQAQMERQIREELEESTKSFPCPACRRIISGTTTVCPRCGHHLS